MKTHIGLSFLKTPSLRLELRALLRLYKGAIFVFTENWTKLHKNDDRGARSYFYFLFIFVLSINYDIWDLLPKRSLGSGNITDTNLLYPQACRVSQEIKLLVSQSAVRKFALDNHVRAVYVGYELISINWFPLSSFGMIWPLWVLSKRITSIRHSHLCILKRQRIWPDLYEVRSGCCSRPGS